MKTKFYCFQQNNSGGILLGKLIAVIVEAPNAEDANYFATQYTPVYLNEVEDGQDCSCCGDRWGEASEYDGADKPHIYGETDRTKWTTGIWEPGEIKVMIRYMNGKIEYYKPTNRSRY